MHNFWSKFNHTEDCTLLNLCFCALGTESRHDKKKIIIEQIVSFLVQKIKAIIDYICDVIRGAHFLAAQKKKTVKKAATKKTTAARKKTTK